MFDPKATVALVTIDVTATKAYGIEDDVLYVIGLMDYLRLHNFAAYARLTDATRLILSGIDGSSPEALDAALAGAAIEVERILA